MKTKLLAMALLAAGSMFAQSRFTFSVGVGGSNRGYYDAPAQYVEERPPCPGPDYFWTDGYSSQSYGRNVWVNGFWARRPYAAQRGGFYEGDHDHGFRRDRDDEHFRDYDRHRDYDRDHDRRYDQRYPGNNAFGNGFRNR